MARKKRQLPPKKPVKKKEKQNEKSPGHRKCHVHCDYCRMLSIPTLVDQ